MMTLALLRTIVRGHIQSVKHKKLSLKASLDSTCSAKIPSSW